MSNTIESGLEQIRPYIVRFRTETSSGSETHGTGVILAASRPPGRVYVATAAHVIPKSGSSEVIRVQVFREVDSDRIVEFEIRPRETTPGVGFVYDSRSTADVGLLAMPIQSGERKEFLDYNEVGAPVSADGAVPAPSTRVSWAGYPGFLRDVAILGRPQLCYFDGSVSALVDDSDRQVFIVDGHAMPGVSGGPAWWHNEATGRVEVFGVISCYSALPTPTTFHPNIDVLDVANQRRDRMPGLCFVQPIRGIVRLIEQMSKFGRPPDFTLDRSP